MPQSTGILGENGQLRQDCSRIALPWCQSFEGSNGDDSAGRVELSQLA